MRGSGGAQRKPLILSKRARRRTHSTHPATSTAAAERVGSGTWLGFLAMCLGMFMAILDIQIVASSLPEIQAAVRLPSHQLSWIQTAYLTAEVIAIPLTGWLTRLLTLRGMFVRTAVGVTA